MIIYSKITLIILISALIISYFFSSFNYNQFNPFILIISSPVLLLLFILLNLILSFNYLDKKRLPNNNNDSVKNKRTTTRIKSIPLPFKFTTLSAYSILQTRNSWDNNSLTLSLLTSNFPLTSPILLSSLSSLLELIFKDFILKWFEPITTNKLFPNAIERTLIHSLKELTKRVERVDWSDVVVGKILPLITEHLERFSRAEYELNSNGINTSSTTTKGTTDQGNSVSTTTTTDPSTFTSSKRRLPTLTESPELSLFLSSKYASLCPTFKLHSAVDTSSPNSKPKEEAWLRNLVEKILPFVMEESEISSSVVGIMTREIVACTILAGVVESVCDEDFWNRLIDEKAGAAIRDQKMVTQFREALDAQNMTSLAQSTSTTTSTTAKDTKPIINSKRISNNNATSLKKTEEISAKTTVKQFELFVKGIGKSKSLLEARRLRSDVGGQIRKTLLMVDGRTKDEIVDGEKVSDLLNYIERLYVAQRRADKRIEELGGAIDSTGRNNVNIDSASILPTSHSQITLREILLSPTSLSYFMEYQDRRNRSLRVQFWLLVEGLKDPLEDINFDSEGRLVDLDSSGQHNSLVLPLPPVETIRTTKEDLKMIWETYFDKNQLSSNQKYLRIVKEFIDSDDHLRGGSSRVTAFDLRKVRRAIFAAQNDVLKEMEEEDFPAFQKSELYFKALVNIPDTMSSSMVSDTMSSSITVSHPTPTATSPQPRIRTISPPTSTSQLPPSIFQRTTSPPPPPLLPTISRPTSPPLHGYSLSTSNIPLLTQTQQNRRTEMAPPQVSFQAALDSSNNKNRPSFRRTHSDERRVPSRKSSVASLGVGMIKRRVSPLSDSLDFLMSPPTMTSNEKDGTRSPLFMEPEYDHEVEEDADEEEIEEEEEFKSGINSPTIGTRTPAGGRLDEDLEDDYVQIQTIEAIQEALNSILATDALSTLARTSNASAGTSVGVRSLSSSQELINSNVLSRQVSNEGISKISSGGSKSPFITSIPTFTKSNPSTSITTTPFQQSKKGKRVFDDYEDSSSSDSDSYLLSQEGIQEEDSFDPKDIRLAAPGDLQLPIEIAKLATLLEKLKSQELVVGQLIRKAELTGISSELKILIKSRESLKREMRGLEFQKSQFEAQESENQLEPGRTTVTISGTTIGQANGQSFQLYLVEVHQLATDGTFGSGWIVTRRYSEFALLHASLKEKYSQARILDLPGKRLVTSYNEEFIEQRRVGLEKFLQRLVKISIICQSNELRSFLSQQNISLPNLEALDPTNSKRSVNSNVITLFPGQSLVRSFYRSVTSGIDEIFTTGPASMMDTIIQRLLSQQAELGTGIVQDEDLVGGLSSKRDEKTLSTNTNENGSLPGGEEGLSYFTAPICDFFVTLFELKQKNNWLRRQAILIILQQILGGTIERKFRDAVKLSFSSDQLITGIEILKNSLWPGGKGELKPKGLPRTMEERLETRDSANRKLSALMPDVAANLIGRTNARMGARRLFAVLQNRRLNKHLLYLILDEIVLVLFPELKDTSFDST